MANEGFPSGLVSAGGGGPYPILTANRQKAGSGVTEDFMCAAIVAYLRDHPEAQDTARGIAQWWLPERGVSPGVQDTERALERLVAEGRVLARMAADGRRHYRLNPGR